MSTPSTATDRSFERILGRLERVKRRGDTATASCPCHKDVNPSLSLRYMPDSERTLLNCFAQECRETDIMAALGLEAHDVWDAPLGDCEVCGKRSIPDDQGRYIHDYCAEKRDGKPAPRSRRTAEKAKPRRLGPLPALIAEPAERPFEVLVKLRETARYEHIDHNGEVVAASVRLEEVRRHEGEEPHVHKTFFQVYSDGHGGTRKTKPEGLRVPLWNLHEIQLAVVEETPVWLVEGHKDALAIEEHAGGRATTNISGALNFTAEDAADLSGAHVNVVCDRDATGYRRAIQIGPLLDGVAASCEFWLPATQAAKSDVYDHLQAGFSLEDLIPVTFDRLAVLELLAIARGGKNRTHRMRDLVEVARESAAHWARSIKDQEKAPKRAQDERRLAQRWALEAGDHLRALTQMRQTLAGLPAVRPEDLTQLDALIADTIEPVSSIYLACEATIDEDLVEILGHDDEAADSRPDADVIALPTTNPYRVPAHRIPMTDRVEWRYDEGNHTTRGVYRHRPGTQKAPGEWIWMSELPYVTARVIKRDGRGARTSMSYLLAMSPEATPVAFNADALRSGTWANALGVELSYDPKVIQAVATAITFHSKSAPERESTPRISPETGRIDIPAEKPDQYFETHPDVDRAAGLEGWRRIVAETPDAPRLAHMMGASAITPFIHALGEKSHTFSVTGAAQRGKTQGLRVAAGIWGNSIKEGNAGSLFGSWNLTKLALPQLLGELGMLPVFRDEGGQAGFTPADWARLIYSVANGVSRGRTDVRSDRASISAPWHGILFTNANGSITEGLTSGDDQGIPRRVIELQAPITADAAQATRLINSTPTHPLGYLDRCYGHLGLHIAEVVDVPRATEYLRRAHALRPLPEGDIGDVARMLLTHLAGSLMIDDLLGTGTQLTDATLVSIDEYMAEWAPTPTEAETMLSLVTESMVSLPSGWPTIDEYLTNGEHGSRGATNLPGHGIRDGILGIVDRNGDVCVLPATWSRMAADAGVNTSLANKQLELDGILIRPRSAQRTRSTTYQDHIRLERQARCYRLRLPEDDVVVQEEGIDEPQPDPPVTGPQPPLQVTPDSVTGSNSAPTRTVTGVTGVTDVLSRDTRDDSRQVATMASTPILDRGGQQGWVTDLTESTRCLMCDNPTSVGVDQLAVDPRCFQASTRTERARKQLQDGSEQWIRLTQAAACVVCGEPASHTLAGLPLHMGDCASQATTPKTPVALPSTRTATPSGAPRSGERFVSDSVVVDVDRAWLGDGSAIPLPVHVVHAGDLVDWATTNRIGWGGNRHHRPEAARIWLTPEVCQRLGLPHLEFETMDDAASALKAMRQLPFFTSATEAGWKISGAEDKPWIKIYQGSSVAIITGMTWGNGRYDAVVEGNPTPQDFAQRLGLLCRTVGFPYTVTPPTTGLASIAYSTTHGLPAVDLAAIPYDQVAANPSWFDRDALEAFFAEHTGGFAHIFDRRKSYLASAGNALLGTGEPIHHRAGVEFNPKAAGFYRVAALTDQPLPWLTGFDALNPAGAPDVDGWISQSRMVFLLGNNITPEILEAYTWPEAESRPQLKNWQASMRDALHALEGLRHDGNPHARALLERTSSKDQSVFKGIYSGGFGKLAEVGLRDPHDPASRYYPHWRAEIVGYHTTNTLRAVQRIHDASPTQPVPVAIGNTDAVVYLGQSTDPADVWPGQGNDALTNTALGKFQPVGYIEVAQWLDLLDANQNSPRPQSAIRVAVSEATTW